MWRVVGVHGALAADGAARIVAVSSTGHMQSPVAFDDVHFHFRRYDPSLAYGQSTTANLLFAVEATRRWARDGITANALMPGAIYTNLQRHTSGRGSVPPELIKTPEQGAATSMLLATAPCSTESAAATSPTATRPKPSMAASTPRPCTAWPATRSTSMASNGCGSCRKPCPRKEIA